MITMYRGRHAAILIGLVSMVGLGGIAHAQTTTHKSFIKRHPTATAVAAGVAAHHIAKHNAHGIVHRHPMATGIAAAAAAHHLAKKK